MRKIFDSDIFRIVIKTITAYDKGSVNTDAPSMKQSKLTYTNLARISNPTVSFLIVPGAVHVNGRYTHMMFIKINNECYAVAYTKETGPRKYVKVDLHYLLQFRSRDEGNTAYKQILSTNADRTRVTKTNEPLFTWNISTSYAIR